MKFIDEYRDSAAVKEIAESIKKITAKPWSLMEICGGQTHSIIKYNLDELLPHEIYLIHGPGCPVCVTPLEFIDRAISIASLDNTILASYGDMVRVPGSKEDLLTVKANGGRVKIVYSPIDALKIAESNKDCRVVFFAVGFETTAPANAMSLLLAKKRGIKNFSLLCSHLLIPPAINYLLASGNTRIDGILAAGHVCTVMGFEEYIPISEKFKIPIVVTGFEPVDILQGIFHSVKQLEQGVHRVENQYSRAVTKEGNKDAKELLNEIFEITDRKWRGIGVVPGSGYRIREEYSEFDAEKIFRLENIQIEEPSDCIAGLVLQGIKKPYECAAFGKICTQEHPLGAPMVSAEGTCAAFFNYRRLTA